MTLRRRSAWWMITALVAGLAVGAPRDSRAEFSITINGTTKSEFFGREFINIAGTYDDLRVVDFGGGAARVFFTDDAQSNQLTLTDALFINTGLAQFFTITFLRDFNGPPNRQVQASVAIDGLFATGSGAGLLSQNTGFNFEGRIEGSRIDDVLSVDVGGKPSGTGFDESGMDRRFLLGPRQLSGELNLTLGQNERLALPGSARIAISAIPEPGSLVLFALGALAILALGRRPPAAKRRSGVAPHDGSASTPDPRH